VQRLLSEWRQLRGMSEWLKALPEELSTLDALAAEQRRRAASARDLLTTHGLRERREHVAQALDGMNARIAALTAATPERTSQWMLTFADADEAKLLNDLSAKRALLMELPNDESRSQLLSRVDYLEGMVFWNLTEERLTRLREAQKQAEETQAILADIDSKLARVTLAEGVVAYGVQTDFLAFQTRADALTSQVAVALADRENRLGDQIRAGIHREIAQVERQLLVTRIAIARATDQLAMEQSNGGGQ